MNEAIYVQKELFFRIKGKLPPNISFVHEISESLEISYDSAYRRIRGVKELSISELFRLCNKYGISIDSLIRTAEKHHQA